MSSSKTLRFLSILLLLAVIVLADSCASTKKNTYYQKRKSASKVNTSQLGRNRYYFSSGYQKKLITNYKKK